MTLSVRGLFIRLDIYSVTIDSCYYAERPARLRALLVGIYSAINKRTEEKQFY